MKLHSVFHFKSLASLAICWMFSTPWLSLAATMTLEHPAHFLTIDGSDIRLEAGSYDLEQAEDWLQVRR